MTLDALRPGEHAIIAEVATRGPQRRRLMDLGLVPGTEVGVELVSPLGDPTAYRVMGTVVVLRRAQAREIHVETRDGDHDD